MVDGSRQFTKGENLWAACAIGNQVADGTKN